MFVFKKMDANVSCTADDLRATTHVLFEVINKLEGLVAETECDMLSYKLDNIKELVSAARSIVGESEFCMYETGSLLDKLPEDIKKTRLEQEVVVIKPPKQKKKGGK